MDRDDLFEFMCQFEETLYRLEFVRYIEDMEWDIDDMLKYIDRYGSLK